MNEALSMGGGVQSTALLVLAIQGIIEKPDVVIFCDTGSELPETIDHINNRIIPECKKAGIEFRIAAHRDRNTGEPLALHEGYSRKGLLPVIGIRSCTDNYKVAPFRRELRRVIGKTKRGVHVSNVWIGISLDEAQRAMNHDNKLKWMKYRYPLLELGLTRADCQTILDDYGWGSTIKSGCFCCPYQTARQWALLRRTHPDLFKVALNMETKAKNNGFRGGLWAGKRSIEGFDVSSLDEYFDLFKDGDKATPTCEVGVCFI